ncbi:MAG: hypothetical protein V3U57_00425 [Robiginitomaculum sp.]
MMILGNDDFGKKARAHLEKENIFAFKVTPVDTTGANAIDEFMQANNN